jgi:translation elongation factor EF-G
MAKVMAKKMTNRNIKEMNDTDVSNSNELVLKRFKMDKEQSGKVFAYRRILSGRWAKEQKKDPKWVDALEELLKTHPALKNLKPENENQ